MKAAPYPSESPLATDRTRDKDSPSVLLIDDHAVVRKGLKTLLIEEYSDITAYEADNGHDGINQISTHTPQAVVLDINLPDMNGLEVLKRIKTEWPWIPVLVLSIYGEDQYGVRMIRAGASGYLAKSSAPDLLVKALKMVVSGRRYISPELAERLAMNVESTHGQVSTDQLSDREYEVFQMLVAGKTVTEIGNELHLSVKTISTHRSHILSKLKLHNNADLVSYAQAKDLATQA